MRKNPDSAGSRKRPIARQALHDLLEDDFHKRAGTLCATCRLPMPTLFASPRDGPNWRLPAIDECANLCHVVLHDLVREYGEKFELEG